MKRKSALIIVMAIITLAFFSFKDNGNPANYASGYKACLQSFAEAERRVLYVIIKSNLRDSGDVSGIRTAIAEARVKMKGMDFWTRYLDPLAYKKVNGPLPVEWETEVFEKFEKPYMREGAGLTLAALYLDEPQPQKDSLLHLVQSGLAATESYKADTVMKELATYHHFFLCNRLYLLNLAAIYTTGFECPDTTRIIPELCAMLRDVRSIYELYNENFPSTPISDRYLGLYDSAISFAERQPPGYSVFDHFTFLRAYVNPLFAINAGLIRRYGVVSHSLVDYTLNKQSTSIFSKSLYNGQHAKGIFLRVKDSAALAEIDRIGKLLFYDPIFSGNNMRSCASCHKPAQYFTDTAGRTALGFNHSDFLSRNSPSLINADFNHLIMMDGRHISLQNQTKGVIGSTTEMGGNEADALRKVMSCEAYRIAFTKLLRYTPQETEVTFDHIASAITYYYCKFSKASAPFDEAVNSNRYLNASAKQGFNIFMSKAQCGTCHFVPLFNGVKPPYVSSEFEVLGVPEDTGFTVLSADSGRAFINPALQTVHAFRTGTIRNAARTAPYMHNGVFRSLREVIDFYDRGGGAGRGLKADNQTLSADPLHLTEGDKTALIGFIESLNEDIVLEAPPARLPGSKYKSLNSRRVGGLY